MKQDGLRYPKKRSTSTGYISGVINGPPRPTTPTPSQGNCIKPEYLEYDTAIYYNNMAVVKASDPQDCACKCRDYDGCDHFVFRDGSKCHLKKNHLNRDMSTTRQSAGGYISGILNGPSQTTNPNSKYTCKHSRVTKDTAARACRNAGTVLAMPKTKVAIDQIRKECGWSSSKNSRFWLGGRFERDSNYFVWDDHEIISQDVWAQYDNTRQKCVVGSQGLYTENCNQARYYVCEKQD